MKGPNKIAEWLRHETSELRVLGSNPAQVDDLDSNPAQVDDHSTIQPGLGGYLAGADPGFFVGGWPNPKMGAIRPL